VAVAGLFTAVAVVAGAPAASAAAPRCTGEGERIQFSGGEPSPPGSPIIYFPAHSPDRVVYGIPNTPGTEIGTGYWSCSLVQGVNNWGVYKLQVAMNICYANVIGAQLTQDGDFGPRTRAALVKVQQSHQISADGQYGPQTARTMRHVNQRSNGSIFCRTLSAAGHPGNSG
jgi:peptidoglycan hydrolase-like protein with peptidoglycan-binding domain